MRSDVKVFGAMLLVMAVTVSVSVGLSGCAATQKVLGTIFPPLQTTQTVTVVLPPVDEWNLPAAKRNLKPPTDHRTIEK